MASWEVANLNKPEPSTVHTEARERSRGFGGSSARLRRHRGGEPVGSGALTSPAGSGQVGSGRGGSCWYTTRIWARFRHVLIMFGSTAPFRADMSCQSKQLPPKTQLLSRSRYDPASRLVFVCSGTPTAQTSIRACLGLTI